MLAMLSKNKKRIVTNTCIILQYLWYFDTNTDEKRSVNQSLTQPTSCSSFIILRFSAQGDVRFLELAVIMTVSVLLQTHAEAGCRSGLTKPSSIDTTHHV